MFCSSCGQSVPDAAAFCPQCGRATAVATPAGGATIGTMPAAIAANPSAAATVATGLVYAGFWLRFVAYLIDSIVLLMFFGVAVLILILATGLSGYIRNLSENPNPDWIFQGAFLVALLIFCAATLASTWLYFACMESSRYQGTLGKMALGLIVTDLQARPVSFGRASGRFFAKIITGLIPLCIGYIMAGFTAKKQALHDMIASCLVLRRI